MDNAYNEIKEGLIELEKILRAKDKRFRINHDFPKKENYYYFRVIYSDECIDEPKPIKKIKIPIKESEPPRIKPIRIKLKDSKYFTSQISSFAAQLIEFFGDKNRFINLSEEAK